MKHRYDRTTDSCINVVVDVQYRLVEQVWVRFLVVMKIVIKQRK